MWATAGRSATSGRAPREELRRWVHEAGHAIRSGTLVAPCGGGGVGRGHGRGFLAELVTRITSGPSVVAAISMLAVRLLALLERHIDRLRPASTTSPCARSPRRSNPGAVLAAHEGGRPAGQHLRASASCHALHAHGFCGRALFPCARDVQECRVNPRQANDKRPIGTEWISPLLGRRSGQNEPTRWVEP